MTLLVNLVYQSFLKLLQITSRLVVIKPKRSSKVLRGLYGRKQACQKLINWGENLADPSTLTFWIHASSVGEALQAKSVAEGLRRRLGEIQIVFTFFSASAEKVAEHFPSEISTYLPWDLTRDMAKVLDALSPSAVLFTQKEVWPNLIEQAKLRGIPTMLVGGTLSSDAKRLRLPWRLSTSLSVRKVNAIGVISEKDGYRFECLGVQKNQIKVTGDPAVDSVKDRVSSLGAQQTDLSFLGMCRSPLIVAGSIWSLDEDILVSALVEIRTVNLEVKMVLVPHEVFPVNIDRLNRKCIDRGLSVIRFSDRPQNASMDNADVLLVDAIGVLPDLYTFATVAYVGGGFGRKGLHSVLEPAAVGVPTLFGPNYEGSLAAHGLLSQGAARVVSDSDDLCIVVGEYLSDRDELLKAGRNALGYIENNVGATDKTIDLICDLLEPINH